MTGETTNYFKQWLQEQAQVRRLLLIDDSMDDCILVQRHTYPYHCEWIISNNYASAEYALKMHSGENLGPTGGIRLIFLDLSLGSAVENGIDAFRRIKDKYPDIPVVVLSGHLSTENIAAITKYGFAMFAQKPQSFSDKYFKELFRIMNIPLRPHFVQESDPEVSP